MGENLKEIKYHIFIDRFNEDSIVVDLGANVGQFSKIFSEIFPYKKIILIEADSNLIKDIKSNLKDIKNVKIINAAVGNELKEKVDFYLSKDSESSSLNKNFRDIFGINDKPNFVNVKMITIDKIFKMFDIKKIDLLKIDIEGSEWDILEKFSKKEFEQIEQISVEFHDFIDPSLRYRTKKCIKRLKKLGYFFIHRRGEFMHETPYKDCLFFKAKFPLLIYLKFYFNSLKTLFKQ